MASDPTSNARYNPLTRQFVPNVITGETHVVAELDFLPGVYGFWLDEAPLVTSTPVIYKGLTQYTVTNGGSTQTVGLGEIFIDFSEMLGLCIVQDVEDGETFTCAYSGLGAPGTQESIATIQNAVLDTKLNKDGSNAMTGNLDLGGFNGINSIAGVNPSDLVIFSQISGIANPTWTASGTTPPSPTPEVVSIPSSGTWFFILLGSGLASVSSSSFNSANLYFGITTGNISLVASGLPGTYSLVGFKLI